MTRQRWYTSVAVLATAVIASASADMGVPMVAIFLPPLWASIVPIILVEAAIICRFAKQPFPRTLAALTVANVVSTIVGVPIAWFILATGEMLCCGGALGLSTTFTRIYAVTVQSPWLIPYESDLGWMIPVALVTLGVVFAALSVLVETPIASRVLRVPSRTMWRGMVWANIASYLLLGFLGWAVAQSGVKLDALYKPFEPLVMALVNGIFAVSSWLAK